MTSEKSSGNPVFRLILRVVLLTVLVSLSFWAYQQFVINFQNIELSNRMVEALLENKTALARQYAQELGIMKDELGTVKENLTKTESYLDKVQQENSLLKKKVAMLDQVAEMEKTIADLKEKNALIINQMSQMEWQSPFFAKKIKDLEEAKKELAKYQERVRLVKSRIREFRREKFTAKVNAQREKDRLALISGNNGFVIRNGNPTLGDVAEGTSPQRVNINVKFVK